MCDEMKLRRLKNDIRTSVPWDRTRYAKAGEIVRAREATNLPEDSRIKYWIYPVGPKDWADDAVSPYGVGVYAEDLESID